MPRVIPEKGQAAGALHSRIMDRRRAVAKKTNARWRVLFIKTSALLRRSRLKPHNIVAAIDVEGFSRNAGTGVGGKEYAG